MLNKLFGGLSGSSNAAAWVLAAGATYAYYTWMNTATPMLPSEVAAFNQKRKAETAALAEEAGGRK
jgi:hypothetical protein